MEATAKVSTRSGWAEKTKTGRVHNEERKNENKNMHTVTLVIVFYLV